VSDDGPGWDLAAEVATPFADNPNSTGQQTPGLTARSPAANDDHARPAA